VVGCGGRAGFGRVLDLLCSKVLGYNGRQSETWVTGGPRQPEHHEEKPAGKTQGARENI